MSGMSRQKLVLPITGLPRPVVVATTGPLDHLWLPQLVPCSLEGLGLGLGLGLGD